eukprot:jgi/Botrbrau1/9386/Bobra.0252s0011.1
MSPVPTGVPTCVQVYMSLGCQRHRYPRGQHKCTQHLDIDVTGTPRVSTGIQNSSMSLVPLGPAQVYMRLGYRCHPYPRGHHCRTYRLDIDVTGNPGATTVVHILRYQCDRYPRGHHCRTYHLNIGVIGTPGVSAEVYM